MVQMGKLAFAVRAMPAKSAVVAVVAVRILTLASQVTDTAACQVLEHESLCLAQPLSMVVIAVFVAAVDALEMVLVAVVTLGLPLGHKTRHGCRVEPRQLLVDTLEVPVHQIVFGCGCFLGRSNVDL